MIAYINQYWGVEQLHTKLTSVPTYKIIRPKRKCHKGLTIRVK